MKTCTLINCNKRLSARGMCSTHYRKWAIINPDKIKKLNRPREVHGLESTAEYSTWCDIKKRTTNTERSDYDNYGGRGIKVCDRWLNSFIAFYQDMGQRPSKKHSIDRIDNNGNYEPSNCRWATRDLQSINRRILKNNVSGITGVRRDKPTGKWRSDIRFQGKLYYLGKYNNIEDAISARKNAENKYFQPILDKHKRV